MENIHVHRTPVALDASFSTFSPDHLRRRRGGTRLVLGKSRSSYSPIMSARFTSSFLSTVSVIVRVLFVGIAAVTCVFATVQVASPFGDHMVLQCESKLPVWGAAAPGETVTVEFAGQKTSTKADANGRWRVDLEPLAASSEPRVFSVGGSSMAHPLRFEDVLVGEVWVCGGQSNMERELGLREGQKPIQNWEQEVANAKHPTIRQLYVTQRTALAPASKADAAWAVCSPETVVKFTAVGYFFARDLQAKIGVPIGIIHSSWGGTPAEAWTSAEGLRAFPEFADALTAVADTAKNPAAAEQAHGVRLSQWFHDFDPGTRDQPWSAVTLDTTKWETLSLPVKWEEAGHPKFDGIVWFRKTFDLPEGAKGDVELRLSAIDDFDTTWINGTPVGSTDGWDTPRVYRVPASALKPKGSVIAVRVLDHSGYGGIWNSKLPFEVASASSSFAPIPLRGPWLCQFAAAMDPSKPAPRSITQGASTPSVLFNGMIAPLVPYAIRGVAFYQGEANADRAEQYKKLFPALIADWRRQWGQGDFPFLFVQIAPYKDMTPEIREAQFITWQTTKNTAMVGTLDCGDIDDIHPAHKQPVGARLALAARALAYKEDVEYSGPVFQSMTTEDEYAVLHFTHLAGGLAANNPSLMGFTLAGPDGIFHAAHGEIHGNTIWVSIPDVVKPMAVRYAWEHAPDGNLVNDAGLPAPPFRTDAEQIVK
jgi:sialate O-acetylesterase